MNEVDRLETCILGQHSPPVRARLLRMWIETLKSYQPRVEPEGGRFADLMEWLEAVAEALEGI
jgi:hypothetical protein